MASIRDLENELNNNFKLNVNNSALLTDSEQSFFESGKRLEVRKFDNTINSIKTSVQLDNDFDIT